MSMYYFSPNNKGFYNSDIHSSMPDDVIKLTDKQYKDLFDQFSTGKIPEFIDNTVIAVIPEIVITWDQIRSKRNKLLLSCDYTQVQDYPGNKSIWIKYRQLLRDIPKTYSKPENVVWPTPPNDK
jgi:hypothetical protein